MEPQKNSSFWPRFTTRRLLLFVLACALLTGTCVHLVNKSRQQFGYGPYPSFEKWPRALVALIGDDLSLRNDVQPFGLVEFIDHRSIWRIKSGSPLWDKLVAQNALEPTDINHPMARELIDSVPSYWTKPRWDRCKWHATTDYGIVHMEGTDLYLIAEDPDSGDLTILHEWKF